VNFEHAAVGAHRPDRLVEAGFRQPKVEHHECLASRDACLDDGRKLGDRIVHPAGDCEAHSVVDRAVLVRRSPPFAQAGEERAAGCLGRAGSRVVEGEERGCPSEGRRDGVTKKAVGLRIARDARVRVDVDCAGQDQQAGGVDHFGRPFSKSSQVCLDGTDLSALDRNVRPTTPPSRHDDSAADEEVGHGLRSRTVIFAARPCAAPGHGWPVSSTEHITSPGRPSAPTHARLFYHVDQSGRSSAPYRPPGPNGASDETKSPGNRPRSPTRSPGATRTREVASSETKRSS